LGNGIVTSPRSPSPGNFLRGRDVPSGMPFFKQIRRPIRGLENLNPATANGSDLHFHLLSINEVGRRIRPPVELNQQKVISIQRPR